MAGVLGSLIADGLAAAAVWREGVAQPLVLGGAGALDTTVIAGLSAVLLAELIGELIERATRGRRRDEDRLFEGGEFRERSRTK